MNAGFILRNLLAPGVFLSRVCRDDRSRILVHALGNEPEHRRHGAPGQDAGSIRSERLTQGVDIASKAPLSAWALDMVKLGLLHDSPESNLYCGAG